MGWLRWLRSGVRVFSGACSDGGDVVLLVVVLAPAAVAAAVGFGLGLPLVVEAVVTAEMGD